MSQVIPGILSDSGKAAYPPQAIAVRIYAVRTPAAPSSAQQILACSKNTLTGYREPCITSAIFRDLGLQLGIQTERSHSR